jgi:hypothetical protein
MIIISTLKHILNKHKINVTDEKLEFIRQVKFFSL